MYMQDTLLRCITISLLPVGDEFGGPCFCPPLFLRSADVLKLNRRSAIERAKHIAAAKRCFQIPEAASFKALTRDLPAGEISAFR